MPEWGSIALGVRISKYPEPAFFQSWTALITAGVRNGDTILMPESHMPAHWAANALARQFLACGRDTLCMIDDDMTFAPDALERLRSNPANQGYDVVMALATHRSYPPKPVIMIPREPYTDERVRRGEVFQTVETWETGDVIPVGALGLAFTLIRRRVFEALRDDVPDDLNFWFSYGQGYESDDIPFCRNARQAGFTLAIDTSVEIGHISAVPLTPDHWRRYMAVRDE